MTKHTIQLSSELSYGTLVAICEAAEVMVCECPGYLARLLQQVRAFRHYTLDCIEQFPDDAKTHHWLDQQSQQVEALLAQTLLELMRRQQFLDESNQLHLDKLSNRARSIALAQISAIHQSEKVKIPD